MIKTEILDDGRILTYSDAGKYIIQVETGIEYESAVDVPNKYTYKESEKDLPKKDDDLPENK